MGATAKSKRRQWKAITKKTKKCPLCPPHGGENAKKKPRTDKYKSRSKGK